MLYGIQMDSREARPTITTNPAIHTLTIASLGLQSLLASCLLITDGVSFGI
jgi:hypothetical protein